MAKLKSMPSLDIINGYKGTIDFYLHDGVPCARSWPRSPGSLRAPAVEAQWPIWKDANAIWLQVSVKVANAYKEMAIGTNLTGRDWFTRLYISGANHLE